MSSSKQANDIDRRARINNKHFIVNNECFLFSGTSSHYYIICDSDRQDKGLTRR